MQNHMSFNLNLHKMTVDLLLRRHSWTMHCGTKPGRFLNIIAQSTTLSSFAYCCYIAHRKINGREEHHFQYKNMLIWYYAHCFGSVVNGQRPALLDTFN